MTGVTVKANTVYINGEERSVNDQPVQKWFEKKGASFKFTSAA